MSRLIQSISPVLLALVPLQATAAPLAQAPDPGGGVAIEFATDAGLGQGVPDGKDARAMAEEFIAAKGWTKDKQTDGFLTVVGSAQLPCMPGHADFQQCRREAFAEAMLDAKRKLAEFLRAEISQELRVSIEVGDPAKALRDAAAKPGSDDLLGKACVLLGKELDKRLAEYGVAPDGAPAGELADKVLGSKEFKSAVLVTAMAELSAIQAYQAFESIGGKNGMVTVVAIHSDKSAQLQRALLGKGPPPLAPSKEMIITWLRGLDKSVLLYTHGAQPRTNERGEVVLVGFGQASPKGDLGLAQSVARKQAETNAQGALRQFMGEFIDANKRSIESSTIEMFDEASEVYESNSSFSESVSAIAGKLGMSGASEIYTWESVHPSTGQKVYGSVYLWSVSAARNANKQYIDFKQAGGGAGGAGSFDLPPAKKPVPESPKTPAGKPSRGSGAQGEEP